MALSENITMDFEPAPHHYALAPELMQEIAPEQAVEQSTAQKPAHTISEDTIADSHYNSIDRLLESHSSMLWRGSDMAEQGDYGHSTGYTELDDILPGRGWPKNSMMEIVTPHWGMGELQLLIPYMREITEQGKWILWISPPYLLNAPALLKEGIDINQILIVQLDTSCKEAMWAIEKALQTESCGLVLAWQNWLSNKVLRRLQLAAEGGETLGVLFHQHDSKDSPSALRLEIGATADRDFRKAQVNVLKARGNYKHKAAVVNVYKEYPDYNGLLGDN